MSAQPKRLAIDFDADQHAYTLNGRAVPSVTQVLSRFDDWSDVPADRLEFARTRGQHAHEAMALIARDALDWVSLDDQLRPYVETGARFLHESGLTIIASELRVASMVHRVAGTLDLLAHWHGAESLLDYKFCATFPRTVGPQTAGYVALYRETYSAKAPRKRFCVLIGPDRYDVRPLRDPRDETIFFSALNCHHYWNPSNASK